MNILVRIRRKCAIYNKIEFNWHAHTHTNKTRREDCRTSLTIAKYLTAPQTFALKVLDRRQVIAATWKVGRHRRQILLRAYMEHQIHADRYMKEKMAMEEPNARIVGAKPQHGVAVIRHCDCVLECWFGEITLQHAQTIQIQSVFQVDLFYCFVR